MLLFLFLDRNYEKIDVVFIRHHTSAEEVDEDAFFHSRETGGTVVSSALDLMHEIIRARYASGSWNIYGAQASDGDNWNDDSPKCRELLAESILPACQYFAYIEVTDAEPQNLWHEYELWPPTLATSRCSASAASPTSTRCSANCSRNGPEMKTASVLRPFLRPTGTPVAPESDRREDRHEPREEDHRPRRVRWTIAPSPNTTWRSARSPVASASTATGTSWN